ncbi:uncharacterized protein [Engystomops pustulosus]|uniref:uncharacterized protein isoform X1 n=1 Tax=Engystomops pustulosus TaxID=76066 RepID=UPI003AFA575D
MKFLWAFLLLAFTIDSVYSYASRSPADYRQVIGRAFQAASAGLKGVKFPPMPSSGILTSGLGSATSLTNVALSDSKLLDLNVVVTGRGLSITTKVILDVSSNDLRFANAAPSINADINFDMQLDMDENYGCLSYTIDKDSVDMSFTIDDESGDIDTDILGVLLRWITGTLKPLIGSVLDTVPIILNEENRAISNTVFMLGDTVCYYKVSGIQYSNGNHYGTFCLICDGGEICPSGPITPIRPEPHEGYVMVFSPELVSAAAELSLIDLSVQIGLDVAQLDGVGLTDSHPDNADFSVQMKVSDVTNLVLKDEAGSMDVLLGIDLFKSDKVIASGRSDVNMALSTGFRAGFMLLKYKFNFEIQIKITFVDKDYDKTSAGTFLKKMMNSHANVLVDKMNCKMERCFPVLPVFGPGYPAMPLPASPPTQGSYHPQTPAPGQCHFRHGSCECSVP